MTTTPTSKRQRTAASATPLSVSSSTIDCATSPRRTLKELRTIMTNLDLARVQGHFSQATEEIEPFVVCGGVSVAVFNRYVDDDERLRIALRVLDLDDVGHVLIVEYPISAVHEATIDRFKYAFMGATGNLDQFRSRGCMTAHRAGNRDKAADATFGPLRSTPTRTSPPDPCTIVDWITLAIEVGRLQTWTSLERSARRWYGYPGIQYIVLLKVSPHGRSMSYRVYDVINNPMQQPGQLPAAAQQDNLRSNRNGAPVHVTFDNRRILSIPAGQALPVGVNDDSVVNLRAVLNAVIESLD